jgi:hypothetical protein
MGAVSTLAAFVLHSLNANFWYSFAFAIAIQFIGWNLYIRWLTSRNEIRRKELDNEMLAELAKQSATLPCAYCGQDNISPIRLDDNNVLKCEGCDQESVVYVNLEVAQKTVPVNLADSRLIINER